MPIIAWIFGNWRLVVGGVALLAILAGGAYVSHVIEKNGKLKAEVKELKLDLKTERENHKKDIALLEDRARDVQERSKAKEKGRDAIEEDRKTGDGPMAPVLHNTLERLRKRQSDQATSAR